MKFIQIDGELFNLDHIDSIRFADTTLYINFVNSANNRAIPYASQALLDASLASIKLQMVKVGVL